MSMSENLNKENKQLNIALIKTLVFFDLFAYPLTAYEAWRYLPVTSSFLEVKIALQLLKDKQKIGGKDGFYFLIGRAKLLNYRQRRYHFANRKIKVARQAAKLFSFLPWIKFVALSNLIGRHNMRDGSDIDLFIITGKNRLWLSRLFCAGLMKILRKRPTKKNKRDKICLSFYVDDDHLDLQGLTLKDQADYYFYYWLAGIYSLYDRGGYHFYLMKNNQWLKKHLPNIDFILSNQAYTPTLIFKLPTSLSFKFSRYIFFQAEKLAEIFQKRIMPKDLKDIANLDSRVVISPGVLKLYLIDRRQEFRQRYFKQLEKILDKND